MKKLILAALFLCAIPVSALWEEASSLTVGNTGTGIAYFLHPAAADLSDLDARDAKNRPIKNLPLGQSLDSLFSENLIHLMVFALPHATAKRNEWIESISHLLNKMIFTGAIAAFRFIQEAILTPNRRFVHNVDNLWTTLFSSLAFTFALTVLRSRPAQSLKLPLRL